MKRLSMAAFLVAAALALPAGAGAATLTQDLNVFGPAAFENPALFDAANSGIALQPTEAEGSPTPAKTIATAGSYAGFPASGQSLILGTQEVEGFDTKNAPNIPTDWNNNSYGNAYDITSVKLGFNVLPGGSCVAFDYRFATTESTDVTTYRDGFAAHLDSPLALNVSPVSPVEASSPGTLALVNGGPAYMPNFAGLWTEISDTDFSRITSTLSASAPVSPGQHYLTLSVFDAHDNEGRSAVQIAGIRVGTLSNGVCGAFVPSNVFSLGKLKLNTKKGTASLATTVDSPGAITVYDSKGPKVTIAAKKKKKKKVALIAKTTVNIAAAGPATLTIKPSKAGKKVLKAKGRLRVKLAIAYKPTGGVVNTTYKTVTLKLKKSKKKK